MLAPMLVRALLLGFLTLSLTLPASVTRADAPPQDARELFVKGQAAYRAGDYEVAVDLWKRAYEIDARPLLLFNLAQAYGRMGKLVEERDTLKLFLETAPQDEPSLSTATSRLSVVERALARTGIAIRAENAEGARVLIDGEDRGLLPRPDAFRVEPGAHRVEIFREGFEPFDARVVVPPGEETAIDVVLEALDVSAVAIPTEASVGATPWILYGAGGALIATGAVLGGLTLAGTADAPPRGSDDAERTRKLAISADVALATGAAVAVTGLVLHMVKRKSSDERAFVPSFGPGYLGFSAATRV